jgi:hypothetical protein
MGKAKGLHVRPGMLSDAAVLDCDISRSGVHSALRYRTPGSPLEPARHHIDAPRNNTVDVTKILSAGIVPAPSGIIAPMTAKIATGNKYERKNHRMPKGK